MILAIDTATKEVKIALVFDQKTEQISWEQGRDLSVKLFENLDCLYKKVDHKINETKGIIVNAGPGSFTGLRIGISTANALAYSLNIPIVGIVHPTNMNDFIESGRNALKGKTTFGKSILPEYGAEPNITQPKGK